MPSAFVLGTAAFASHRARTGEGRGGCPGCNIEGDPQSQGGAQTTALMVSASLNFVPRAPYLPYTALASATLHWQNQWRSCSRDLLVAKLNVFTLWLFVEAVDPWARAA